MIYETKERRRMDAKRRLQYARLQYLYLACIFVGSILAMYH